MPPITLKNFLKDYLGNVSNVETAIVEMKKYASSQNDVQMLNDLILLQAQLSVVERNLNLNFGDPQLQERERTRIIVALLDICDNIPENALFWGALMGLAQKGGIFESRLKWHIFVLLMMCKFTLIFVIGFHTVLIAVPNTEGQTAIGLLLPIFASYGGMMYKDFLANRHATKHKGLKVSRAIQWTVYAIIFLYFISVLFVIAYKTIIDQSLSLVQSLSLIESFLGIYIGMTVSTFFKEK
jgi:hypothetical protein